MICLQFEKGKGATAEAMASMWSGIIGAGGWVQELFFWSLKRPIGAKSCLLEKKIATGLQRIFFGGVRVLCLFKSCSTIRAAILRLPFSQIYLSLVIVNPQNFYAHRTSLVSSIFVCVVWP